MIRLDTVLNFISGTSMGCQQNTWSLAESSIQHQIPPSETSLGIVVYCQLKKPHKLKAYRADVLRDFPFSLKLLCLRLTHSLKALWNLVNVIRMCSQKERRSYFNNICKKILFWQFQNRILQSFSSDKIKNILYKNKCSHIFIGKKQWNKTPA